MSRASRPATEGWYDDSSLVAGLPRYLRLYAAYSRWAVRRSTGRVIGGSFLLRVFRRLAPILGLPREARVVIAGHVVYLDLTDVRFLWVIDELRGRGDEARVLRLLLRPGDTFLDVGANHGSFAILASHVVGPDGLVVAVEPQPRLASLIRRSLAEAPAPFQVHAVALGEQNAEMPLHVPREGSGAASLVAPQPRARLLAVPVRRADDLLPWTRFPGRTFVKLDVEGAEIAFLRGASRMTRALRPTILFELSPTQQHAAGYRPEDLIAQLDAMGYCRFAEVDRLPEEIAGPLDDLERQRNLLALPHQAPRLSLA